MSTISHAITRALLLWVYVGIGPMIGAGPLDAPPVRRVRRDTRKAVPEPRQARGATGSLGLVPSGASSFVIITKIDPAPGQYDH
jgi:hypothetical protein